MKYIDADKLIAEIDKQMGECVHGAIIFKIPEYRCLKNMRSFITSLQQEQPEVDIDIKQELYHHFGQVKDFTLSVAIASYFYELGLNARKEETK